MQVRFSTPRSGDDGCVQVPIVGGNRLLIISCSWSLVSIIVFDQELRLLGAFELDDASLVVISQALVHGFKSLKTLEIALIRYDDQDKINSIIRSAKDLANLGRGINVLFT